jgi:hypothetical protein
MPFLEGGGSDSAPHSFFKGGAPSTENEWDRGEGVLDCLYIYIDIVNLYSALCITMLGNVMLYRRWTLI